MKLTIASLSLAICGASVAFAADKPAPAAVAMKEAARDTDSRAAAATSAAIEALGANPSTRQISSIVFKAVRSSPESVLTIVNAAVQVSPQTAAPEIVTAATAAVPNPWKQVVYHRLSPVSKRSRPDGKGGPDGKGTVNPAGPEPTANDGPGGRGSSNAGQQGAATADPGTASREGNMMTLAEAITLTAFDAQPGLSFAALQAGANTALLGDPAALLRRIQSPASVSGVGDAGTSNYANEPLRTPKQPVVSR